MAEKKEEKKTAAKKTPAKATAGKATATKKKAASTAKKAPGRKSATAKAAVKKTAAKKPVARKESAQKAPKKKVVSKSKRKLVEFSITGENYFAATGKRKSAVARVRIFPKGSGQIEINGRKIEDYFFGTLISNATEPVKLAGIKKEIDATVKIAGGGTASQSDAVRHGLAQALVKMDAANRPVLKKAGFISRDSRVKERKKPGLKGARRAPQFSKR